jgi:2-dehydropantoate 2-reductase
VIVSVKVPSLPGIAAGLPALLKPDTPVVFLNNGIPWWYYQGLTGPEAGKRLPRLDPGDGLLNAVGPDRIIGGVFWPACTVPRPGVIRIIAVGGKGTILGTPSGKLTPGLQRVADAFHLAGLQAEATARIRDVIWEKLSFNLSAGPMCVLTTTPVKDTHVEEACIVASRNLVTEALALIRAMGCHVEIDMERVIAANRQLAHRPSILQDLLAGRKMEINSLYVTPLDMARDAGVPMPTLELLAALIKVRARAAGLYDG